MKKKREKYNKGWKEKTINRMKKKTRELRQDNNEQKGVYQFSGVSLTLLRDQKMKDEERKNA